MLTKRNTRIMATGNPQRLQNPIIGMGSARLMDWNFKNYTAFIWYSLKIFLASYYNWKKVGNEEKQQYDTLMHLSVWEEPQLKALRIMIMSAIIDVGRHSQTSSYLHSIMCLQKCYYYQIFLWQYPFTVVLIPFWM